uniref:Uncharacterized protein n=1 Tax=Anguilla anguilla TaxID=7936 RepID=A0A0E9THY0_ANGAN
MHLASLRRLVLLRALNSPLRHCIKRLRPWLLFQSGSQFKFIYF